MEPDEEQRRLRIILRRPEAVEQVTDLAAIPNGFDRTFSKTYYAHQLRLAGHDWPWIARKLGYKNGWAAESAVRKWQTKKIDSRSVSATAAALQAEAVRLDLDRLDTLMAAYWDEAIGGDLPSAHYVLRLIAQRARYLVPESGGTGITNQINTLVVGGSESEYVGALLKARASIGPAPRVIDAEDDQSGVVDLEPSRE